MISFQNPKFHEKIMEKYGKKIKKSYFPNLFFKKDCKSTDPRKKHISFTIKFDFYNTLFWKNFPLSSQKGKENKDSESPLNLKTHSLSRSKAVHNTSMSLYLENGKHKPQKVTSCFTSPVLPSRNFKSQKLIPFELISLNLAFNKFISHEIKVNDFQLSNLPLLNPTTSELLSLNYPSTYFTFSNSKSVNFKSYRNNGRAPSIKIIDRTQILRNHKNFLLDGNRLFFTHSRIPAISQAFYKKVGNAEDPPGYLSIPIFAASGLSQRIHNKIFKEIKELKLSSRDSLLSVDIPTMRSGTQIKSLRTPDGSLELLSRHSKPMHMRRRQWAREVMVENSQRGKHPASRRSKKVIWEKQELIVRKEKQNSIGKSEKQDSIESKKRQSLTKRMEKTDLVEIREKTDLTEIREEPNSIEIREKRDLRELIDFSSWESVTENRKRKNESKIRTNKAEVPVLIDSVNNLRTLSGSRMTQNTSFFPPVQLLIRNLPKKNAFFLYRKDSSGPENKRDHEINKDHESKRDHESNKNHESKRYVGYNISKRVSLEYFTNIFPYFPEINKIGFRLYDKNLTPSIEKQTKSLQSTLKFNSFIDLELNNSEHILNHEFNWLTILRHNTAVISKLNWLFPFTSNDAVNSQLGRSENRTLVSSAAFQFGLQGINRPESVFFSPGFHEAIRQASRGPSYAKIGTLSYTFKHLEVSKSTSEVSCATGYHLAEYQLSDPHAAGYYTNYNQKVENKREMKLEKPYPLQINRLQNTLNQQIFIKSLGIITNRLRKTESVSYNSSKNNIFYKTNSAADSSAYPFITVYTTNDFSRKIHNEIRELINSWSWNSVTENYKLKYNSHLRENKATMPSFQYSINNSQALPDSAEMLNTSLSPSIKYLIQNFVEKNAFFLHRIYSSVLESNEISRSMLHEQKTGQFPFSKKDNRRLLSKGRVFSTKKRVAEIKNTEKLGKKLLILQNLFLQGDTQVIHDLNVQPTSKLFTIIRGPLHITKREILSIGDVKNESASNWSARNESAGSSRDHKIKSSMFYKRSEGIFFESFTHISQKYRKIIAELRAKLFERVLTSPIEKQIKNLQSVPILNLLNNMESKSSERKVTSSLNNFTNPVENLVAISQLNQQFPHIFSSTTVSQLNQQETYKLHIMKLKSSILTPCCHSRFKPASKALIPLFNIPGVLLAGNKPTRTIAACTIDSSENIFQGEKYHALNVRLHKIFGFSEAIMPSSIAAIGNKNPAHFQKTPFVPEYPLIPEYNNVATYMHNLAIYMPEKLASQVHNFIKNRIFYNLMNLMSNSTKEYTLNYTAAQATDIKKIYSHPQQTSQVFNYAGIRTFSYMFRYAAGQEQINEVNLTTYYPTVNYHLSDSQVSYHTSQASYHYTTSDEKVDNKREQKRGIQYYFQINKLQGTFNQLVFPKYFEKIIYGYGRTKALLNRAKQSIISNKTSTPTLSLREVYSFSSKQNPAFNNTSAYSGKHPVPGESYYQTTNTQSYPVFLAFDYGKNSSLNYFGIRIHNLKAGTIDFPAINYYIRRKAGNSSTLLNEHLLEKRIHLENRNGLSLSILSLFFQRKETSIPLSKKEILEYFRILYSPSGSISFTTTEYSLTLSKTQNQIIRGRLPSKELYPNGLPSNEFSPNGFSLNESSSNELAQNRILSKGPLSKGPLSKGFLSKGFLSKELLSKGFLSKELLSKGFLSKGFSSKELLSKGFLSKGFLSKELLSKGFLSNGPISTGFLLSRLLSNEFLSIKSISNEQLSSGNLSKGVLSKGLLSSGIFLGRPFYDSVPLLSRGVSTDSGQKVIQVPSLNKYASLIIPQNTVFASESENPLNTEFISLSAGSLGHLNAYIPNFNERQKLNGQNVPDRKKARANLSLKAVNRENANGRSPLKRHSTNSLRQKNSSHQVNKNMYILAGSRMRQWIFSNTDTILSTMQAFTQEMDWKNVFFAPTPEKKQEYWTTNSKRLFSGLTTQGSDKTAYSHLYPGSNSNNFVFPRAEVAGQSPRTSAFGTSGKGRPELMHAGETNYKAERGELVHGTPQTLLDEVKRIEKVVFETKEAIADHLESHLQQAKGKAEQSINIGHISEKIMQMIDHRAKIEAERRGIF